jgi:hypothetical protein
LDVRVLGQALGQRAAYRFVFVDEVEARWQHASPPDSAAEEV